MYIKREEEAEKKSLQPIAKIRNHISSFKEKTLIKKHLFLLVAAMTILRIPDLVDAVFQMEVGVHPDQVEVTQASDEWFAR